MLKKIFASVGTALIAFFAVFQLALAQSQQERGGNGLQISPTRTELSLSPGERKTFNITVKNITGGNLTAEVSINDFESDGVTGNPQIIVDDSVRTPTSIFNFIDNLKSVKLKPGETKRLTLNVSIPDDATPGAYYGVVRYAVIPEGGILSDRERQLALNASIGHLVLIEIAGDITEQMQIEGLSIGKSGNNGEIKTSTFFFSSPDKSLLTINNLGNGFSRPFGDITINRMFGGEVHKTEVNNIDPRGIVLPQSTRVFTDEVGGIKIPGRYTATAAIAYGNGGEVVTYKASFWYLPIWFLLILLAIVVTIGFWLYRRYKRQFSGSKKKRK
ncbi:MAG TPA: hypothetical protein VFX79_02075 [Candidatus Saccharimonadales bacterium]|nr:hypothetical protein [Candidatus Saccharimonadales bacterium]